MSRDASGSRDPGRLDRRVVLQYPVSARDAMGGSVVTWVNAATVSAEKRPVSGGRFYAAEAKHYVAQLTYRIRWRRDVAEGWRLVHGDDVFEIVHAAEQGRQHFLDLELRALDQVTGNNGRSFDVLLLEDGSPLLQESDSGGDLLLLEDAQSPTSVAPAPEFLVESGADFHLEDDTPLLLETAA